MELTEEDQMLQAIAMSLGEDVQMSSSSSGASQQRPATALPKPPPPHKEIDDEPLTKETLGNLSI